MIMRFKTKLSYFEFVYVGIWLLAFVLVHLFEEFGTLVVFYVCLGVQVVFVLFYDCLCLEFGYSSVLDLLVQLLLDLLFLSLSLYTLVFQSLSFVVLFLFRLEFFTLFG